MRFLLHKLFEKEFASYIILVTHLPNFKSREILYILSRIVLVYGNITFDLGTQLGKKLHSHQGRTYSQTCVKILVNIRPRLTSCSTT